MSTTDHALRRDSMADRVKNELLRRIMTGELEPGARLVELKLAKELDTSQGPVREALCELEGLELVVTEPYKGTRVREVTPKDIQEAYMVRARLEQLAAQLAGPRFKDSPAKISLLKKAAEAVREAAKNGDIAGYARNDMRFHRQIVEASENRILLRSWNSLAFEVRLQMWLSRSRVDLVKVQRAHWKIIEALAAGDGMLAGELLERHIYRFPAEIDSICPENKSAAE